MFHPTPSPPVIRNEHLLTLETIAGSAAITVTPREGGNSRFHPFPDGVQISPACSTDVRTSRCRRLYINASDESQFIILATLENAVGLMSFQYDGAELVRVEDSVLSITETLGIGQCVPLEIIHFGDRPMVLCLNQRQLVSCDVKLNRSNITQSSLVHCIPRLHTFHTAVTYEQMSNFVYFPETRQVVFIFQGFIYGIRFDSTNLRLYIVLDDSSCDRVVYAGDHTFYASCRSGKVFKYNTDTEVLDSYLPHDEGVPVPCPSSSFTLLQGGNDTVVTHSSGFQLTIAGFNFSSGVCSPAGILYITDQLGGITAVNARSSQHIGGSVRSSHLEVFDGDYLVILSDDPSKSVLYNESLERIAERSGGGQVVGVISNLTITQMMPITPPPTVPPLTSPDPSSTSTVPPTKKPVEPPKAKVLTPGQGTGVGIGILLFFGGIALITVILVVVLR